METATAVVESVAGSLSSAGKCFANSHFYPVRVLHKGQEDHKISTNASNNTYPSESSVTSATNSTFFVTFLVSFSNKYTTDIYSFMANVKMQMCIGYMQVSKLYEMSIIIFTKRKQTSI